MSWVTEFKRRVSLTLQRNTSENQSQDFEGTEPSPIFTPPLDKVRFKFPVDNKVQKLIELIKKLAIPNENVIHELVIQQAIDAFQEAITSQTDPLIAEDHLEKVDSLPEFCFSISQYVASRLKAVCDNETLIEEEKRTIITALAAIRVLVQFQKNLAKAVSHTNLPKFFILYKQIFSSQEFIPNSFKDSNFSESSSNENFDSSSSVHQAIISTLGLLLLNDHFVKDLVLKNHAADLFVSFLSNPDEGAVELVGCATRNAAERANGLGVYITSKDFIRLCCTSLSCFLENKSHCNGLFFVRIIRLINQIMEEFIDKSLQISIDFASEGGYVLIAEFLLSPPFEEKFDIDLKVFILSILENLIFIGPEKSKEEILDLIGIDEEYEIEFTPVMGPCIRNFSALSTIIFVLLFPKININGFNISEHSSELIKNEPPPDSLKIKLLKVISNLASISHINYLLICSYNPVMIILENFSNSSFQIQEAILRLLVTSVQRFGHSPMKEFVLISVLLKENIENKKSLQIIYDALGEIAQCSSPSQNIARSTGIFESLLNSFDETLSSLKSKYSNIQHSFETQPLVYLQDVDGLVDLNQEVDESFVSSLCFAIRALLSANGDNSALFKKKFPDLALEFLYFNRTRNSFLSIIEVLLKTDLDLKLITNSQECGFSKFQIITHIIRFLEKTLITSILTDVFNFLQKFLSINSSSQIIFVKSGALICLISFISKLRLVEPPENPHNTESIKILQGILSTMLSAIIKNHYAQWFLIEKIGLAAFEAALEQTGILNNKNLVPAVFSMLFGLIMGKCDLINYSHGNTWSDLASSPLLFGYVELPCFLPVVFYFSKYTTKDNVFENTILDSLWKMTSASTYNQILFSQQPIAQKLLKWNDTSLHQELRSSDTSLAILQNLLEFGVNDLNISFLFKDCFRVSEEATSMKYLDKLELLQSGIERGISPNVFHFDSYNTRPSIKVDGISRQIWIGHSIALWTQFVHFPDDDELFILQFDSGSAYRLCVCKDRRLALYGPDNLLLSFDCEPLCEETWYHIALVHSKLLISLTGGIVSLYINGSLIEHQKHSMINGAASSTLVIGDSKNKSRSSVWNLSALAIFNEVVEPHVIKIMHQLGAEYSGTFQDPNVVYERDCYEVRKGEAKNETTWISKDSLILALYPKAICMIQNQDNNCTRQRGILNEKYPWLDIAKEASDGIAWLSDGVLVSNGVSMAMALWRVGGCTLLLKFVEKAQTSCELERAISLLISALKFNRFKKEMVQIRGHEILGYLLKNKPSVISPTLVRIIVGLVVSDPTLKITNPSAFQQVILDFDIWKATSLDTQTEVTEVILEFCNSCHDSNKDTLNDLTAIKRLLFVLRYDIINRALLPKLIEAIKCLLVARYTQENIRLIVAFITSTLTRERHEKHPIPASSRIDKSAIISDVRKLVFPSYQMVVGNAVLGMLHDLLQKDENCAKMATVITSKWLILLITTDDNPYAIIFALRILSRLFLLGSTFVNKFCFYHEGFVVLGRVLPKWWFLAQLYPVLFSIMLDVRIETISLNNGVDFFSLVSLVSNGLNSNRELSLESCLIFFRLIKNCLSFCQPAKDAQTDSLDQSVALFRTLSITDLKEQSSRPQNNKSDGDYTKMARISRMVQTLLQFATELYHSCKLFRRLCTQNEVLDVIASTLFVFSANFKSTALSQFDYNYAKGIQTVNFDLGEYASSFNHIKPSASTLHQLHRRSMTMPESSTSILNPSLNTTAVIKNEAIESFVEFTAILCSSSLFDIPSTSPKPLVEIEKLLKAPFLGTFEGYIKFTNFFLFHLLRHIQNTLQLSTSSTFDIKAHSWIVKFSQLCVDSCYQGGFTSGRLLIFDFLVSLLDKLHDVRNRPLESRTGQHTKAILKELNRIILYCFTEATSTTGDSRFTTQFLKSILLQHAHIFSPNNNEPSFWKCLCFHLFELLQFESRNIRIIAFNIYKLLVLMKKPELVAILNCKDSSLQSVMGLFLENLDTDLETFSAWLDSNLSQVKLAFEESIKPHWEEIKFEKMTSTHIAATETRYNFALSQEQLRQNQEDELRGHQKAITNTISWARKLQRLETEGYLKLLQDQSDNNIMVTILWKKAISRSSSFPENNREKTRWKLDLTEGPFRMRRRLKPNRHTRSELSPSCKYSQSPIQISVHKKKKGTTITYLKLIQFFPEVESFSLDGLELASEPNDENISQVEEIELQNNASETDSKVYRVLRYMEPSEEVLEIFNIGRVTGLEVTDALLMFCTFNMYVIDGYFLCSDGTIVETSEIPDDEKDTYLQLLAAASKTKSFSKSCLHQCRKCTYSDIKEIHKRKFLFRNVALEVFFADGRNILITALITQRDYLYQRFTQKLVNRRESVDLDTTFGARLTSMFFGSSSLSELTLRWERREITNFEYLMHINTFAGRSYNDLTQYPVFPWILSDYTSEVLDLSNPGVFRDLSKPMGAQSEVRAREFDARYSNLIDDEQPPFHYGTHYSSAMIVCWYLIRLEPFTSHHLQLQGGYFDHPDRLFLSIKEAWLSAAFQNTTDVRELIPEFFYLPEFLVNHNRYDFGLRQDKKIIDAVFLPPWAYGSPELFVRKNREALESEFVSQHLNEWIDLIFGFKQQGTEAVDSLNVFHHLSYQDAVDLDAIIDPVEKQATVGIINNFGQTPLQIFKKPHPKRCPRLPSRNFDLTKNFRFLIKSHQPLLNVEMPVTEIILSNDRLLALGGSRIFLPRLKNQDQIIYIEWGLLNNCVRLFQSETNKLLGTFEELHLGKITVVKGFNSTTIITGGDDFLVKVWELKFQRNSPKMILKSIFRGADAPITAICACSDFGIVVVGTSSNKVYIWDVARAKFIISMTTEASGITSLNISKSSGVVIACSDSTMSAWTLNGSFIASLILPTSSPKITSCIFLESSANGPIAHDSIITGHQGGILQLWSLGLTPQSFGDINWSFKLINTITESFDIISHHLEDILTIHVSPSRQVLFCGTRCGSIYSYQFPDTSGELHWAKESTECCVCKKNPPGLDRKVFCAPCGGLVCNPCSCDSPFLSSSQAPLIQCRLCLQKYCLASEI